jgi:hypothetical protein
MSLHMPLLQSHSAKLIAYSLAVASFYMGGDDIRFSRAFYIYSQRGKPSGR